MSEHKPATDYTGKEYQSVTKMCQAYHIPSGTLNYRLKHGWNLRNSLILPTIPGIRIVLYQTFADGTQYFKVGSKLLTARQIVSEYGTAAGKRTLEY